MAIMLLGGELPDKNSVFREVDGKIFPVPTRPNIILLSEESSA
jgi:hypothetical protein